MSAAMNPSERALRDDCSAVPFECQIGLKWGEPRIEWPYLYVWMHARPTQSGVTGYWFRLDCSGYPQQAPTGTFWDMERNAQLDNASRPWGRGEVELTFRIDWPGTPYQPGSALYLACDRIALATHSDWTPQTYPATYWTPDKGVLFYLEEVSRHLHSPEYTGPRGTAP